MKDRLPEGARAKLTDVAKEAGVSLATASRALNQPKIVRPEIRERVLKAVQSLGYTPDRTAKALSSGRSHIVGAVVPTLGNAIFADGVEALQDQLETQGYTLLLSNSQYDRHKELRQVQALLEHGVDGLVLVGDGFLPEVVSLVRQYDVPTVVTYVCASRHGLPAIGIDNAEAAAKMTRYLLELGHREFGVVSNTALPNDRSQARLSGMLAAMTEAGVRLRRGAHVEVARPTIANGRRAFDAIRTANPNITALLCTTDALAVGAIAEAQRLSVCVPADLSVVGFDDVELASEVDPPLTTVNVPAIEISRIAAGHLLSAISGNAIPLSTRLPAPLILRDSTAVSAALAGAGRTVTKRRPQATAGTKPA
jgi:LacI family transcriptional regulator